MTNKNFLRLRLLRTLPVIIFFVGLLLAVNWSRAQYSSNAYNASSSPDAIAIRIIPNPNHYSIARWYADQGFQGSPQSLLVDGYEAIRDGRTVYVNAANVDQNTNPPSIYTNIYLISYNQNPAPNTVDILGQIISHWQFNNGLIDNNPAPSCSISSIGCSSDSDCGSGQVCATSGSASSSCQLVSPVNCLVDTDCPANFFCDSLKSKITRDVKRAGQLADLNVALDNFKNSNGHYPLLAAGTYWTGHSVSLWPSWSQVFLSDIAAPQSSVDPINRLGACPGYDPTTCWNNNTKQFFQQTLNLALTLPAYSYALAYSTNSSGSSYSLCTTLESRNLSSSAYSTYVFAPNNLASSACPMASYVGSNGTAADTAPQLVASMLSGIAGQAFNGFVKVADPDGDSLTWAPLNTSQSSWTGWSQAPTLFDTSNPSQKKVYASLAGSPGTYNIGLRVDDGRGSVFSTSTVITILSPNLSIQAENAEYILDSSATFAYNFYFSGTSIVNASNNYSVVKTAGTADILSYLTPQYTMVGPGLYEISYFGSLPTTLNLSQGTSTTYRIKVIDKYNQVVYKSFTINIVPAPIPLNFNCSPMVRAGQPYSCVLGNSLSGLVYSVSGLPSGLSMTMANGSVSITGSPAITTVGVHSLTVTATDPYGSKAVKDSTLQVNSYCGDGLRQTPNTELAGGPNNDGYEDCDGSAGITTNASSSNIRLQYGCTTIGATTYPILDSNQCTYKSPTAGGGYCGDGYCEASLENCNNCAQDCGACKCVPNCSNKPNGASDGCNGTCVVGSNICGNPIADATQTYGTVQIGQQCWMSQNLNTGTMLSSANTTPNPKDNTVEKWCYNNDPMQCIQYGGLYSWSEAMGGSVTPAAQGICPAGWHVPTDQEYKILEIGLGMSQADADTTGLARGTDQGTQLKSGTGGTSGFNGLLAGVRNASSDYNFKFTSQGVSGYFISSTLANASTEFVRGLEAATSSVYRIYDDLAIGNSLRCLKNCAPTCTGQQLCGTSDGCGSSCLPSNSNCCTPKTCNSVGATCGNVSDDCGGTLSCGTCSNSQHCTAGSCVDNCKTCANAASDGGPVECGTPSDGCGNNLNCGSCNAGYTCSALNTCEVNCKPKTCTNAGLGGTTATCGTPSNGCGGTLNCGSVNNMDCSNYLGWPANSFNGQVTCGNNYIYNTGNCVANLCNSGSSTVPSGCYWYQVPISEDNNLTDGMTCMVKMPVKSDNSIDCNDFPSASENTQWFRGAIVKDENYNGTTDLVKICAVTGCATTVNPNKCRYYNKVWTNQCYVHKTW